MAKSRILSVEYQFPGDLVEQVQFNSDRSLLDADIILFEPVISSLLATSYGDDPVASLLDPDGSTLVRAMCHRRAELEAALEGGRTIFVFLSRLQKVRVPSATTGGLDPAGRGLNNYSALPVELGNIVGARGQEIRVAKDLGVLAAYWRDFASSSAYEVYLEDSPLEPLLVTKTGNKLVGSIKRVRNGTIVLLPPVRYSTDYEDEDSLVQYNEEEGEEYWTDEGMALGPRLLDHLVAIDRELRAQGEGTPSPEWSSDTVFQMSGEPALQSEIADLTRALEELEQRRADRIAELEQLGSLRRLLYATGKPLESAILEALILLGFEAQRYVDAESEFDAIFVSPEGRFLGEAEGKDNRAINVDKISQLIRNIGEDVLREDVAEPAKGILFGNAFRLEPPARRGDFFTSKCASTATAQKIVLVRTTDLFEVARYLKEHGDSAYAQACRRAIADTSGVVSFPPAPTREQ